MAINLTLGTEEQASTTEQLASLNITTARAPQYPTAPDQLTQRISTEIEQLNTEVERMTPEERQQISEFATKIDLTDPTVVSNYGVASQNKQAQFADESIAGVSGRDLGDIGKLLVDLSTEVKGFSGEDLNRKGIMSFFKGARKSLEEYRAQYTEVSKIVDGIAKELTGKRIILEADVKMLDQLYKANLERYKELTMYIMAGKQRLAEVEATDLQELRQKAAESGSQLDAQAVRDLEDSINRFEKRITDLELTRTIAMQMAPQIRMVQGTNVAMSDKIQSTVANTIPLWKSNAALAVALEHQRGAIEAQNAVTNATNELLIKHSEALKTNAVEGVKASERGIVDIETLEKTNQNLLATIDEILEIQQDSRQKRKDASKRLQKIEDDLRQRLLAASNKPS